MVDSERIQNQWMPSGQTLVSGMDGQGSFLLGCAGTGIGRDGEESSSLMKQTADDGKLGVGERAFSAAGAAFLSAIIVNPLDVAKTRLQAQAAGVNYSHPLGNMTYRMANFGPNMLFADLRCSPSCTRAGIQGTVSICPPECFQYKGALDVLYKIVQQEGFSRLWRGTNAGLALAVPTVGIYLPCYDILRNWLEEFAAKNIPSTIPYVPLVAGSLARSLACATCYPIELARTRMQSNVKDLSPTFNNGWMVTLFFAGALCICSGISLLVFPVAFKETQIGRKPPGVFQTLLGVVSQVKSTNIQQNSLQGYRVLWTGMSSQLARDVPFSAICWSTLEPMRRKLVNLVGGDEANAMGVLGANFSAGFVAGSLAAGATCPLDVAKTRRQIERDPARALKMTTRQTLMEVWREGGLKGLFTGVGPRVGRAGPSVGIVVSFYEVVKYVLHNQSATC